MRYILFLFSFSFSILLSAQSAAEFRTAAQAALEAYNVPGFSVGIIKDGEIVLAEGFGTRTANKEEKVDEHTLFAIASNTKAFVATALAKLEQEGKLSLNDPVRKHLPYFELYDEYVSEHMMVRDLLCHRAGLGTFSGDAVWYKSEQSAEEVIKRIKHLPQAYEWRAGYGYSNLMFITAGEVIKAVSGQTWAEYVQANFFEPLDMERSQTSVEPLKKMKNVATPHISRNDNEAIAYVNWDNMGAAGGIISSTSDMLKWIQCQIDAGSYKDNTIFPEQAQQQTWKPHNALGNSETFTSAGLGWFLSNKDGRTVISHGGGYDGMYSQVKIVPQEKLGIVILSNSMTGIASNLSNYIVDAYLGKDTKDWLEKAVERQVKSDQRWIDRRQDRINTRIDNTQASVDKTAYTGTYTDPLYGDIVVELEGDELFLNFPTAPGLNARLSHWHYDTWKIEWNEEQAWFDFGTVQFVIDNQRKVKSMAFDVPNNDIFFHEIKALKKE